MLRSIKLSIERKETLTECQKNAKLLRDDNQQALPVPAFKQPQQNSFATLETEDRGVNDNKVIDTKDSA